MSCMFFMRINDDDDDDDDDEKCSLEIGVNF